MAYSFGDWAAEIEAVSSDPEFQNATIRLYTLNQGTYNVDSGAWTGGTPSQILGDTRARIIGIRSANNVSGSANSNPSEKQRVRVQFPFAAYTGRVKPGVAVRVMSGGRNAALTGYLLIVVADNLSSNRASHTLECTVDLEAVASWA